jgi:hypothetical protein
VGIWGTDRPVGSRNWLWYAAWTRERRLGTRKQRENGYESDPARIMELSTMFRCSTPSARGAVPAGVGRDFGAGDAGGERCGCSGNRVGCIPCSAAAYSQRRTEAL